MNHGIISSPEFLNPLLRAALRDYRITGNPGRINHLHSAGIHRRRNRLGEKADKLRSAGIHCRRNCSPAVENFLLPVIQQAYAACAAGGVKRAVAVRTIDHRLFVESPNAVDKPSAALQFHPEAGCAAADCLRRRRCRRWR